MSDPSKVKAPKWVDVRNKAAAHLKLDAIEQFVFDEDTASWFIDDDEDTEDGEWRKGLSRALSLQAERTLAHAEARDELQIAAMESDMDYVRRMVEAGSRHADILKFINEKRA